jgi:hypothetical protein
MRQLVRLLRPRLPERASFFSCPPIAAPPAQSIVEQTRLNRSDLTPTERWSGWPEEVD